MITSFVSDISVHIHADKCADLFASFTNTSNWNLHSVPLYKRQILHLSYWTAGQFSVYILQYCSPLSYTTERPHLLFCCWRCFTSIPVLPHSALEGLVLATSWQKELCKAQEKELCKTQESLSALPNSYFREAAKTISRSVFKTQQWNSLELPVHISHSQKHTHM